MMISVGIGLVALGAALRWLDLEVVIWGALI